MLKFDTRTMLLMFTRGSSGMNRGYTSTMLLMVCERAKRKDGLSQNWLSKEDNIFPLDIQCYASEWLW
jgi:hypothetical protein